MPEDVVIELAARTVSSDRAKDSQNNVKLVVDLGDKGATEIPLTGKLVVDLQQNSGTVSTVNSDGAKDSQNNVKLVVDLGDKRAMEIPLTGKLVVDQQQNSDAVSTINSDGAKDSQKKVNNDSEFFMEMRGWLLTVATLFVAMAFQGAMQPPGWMPKGDWIRVLPKDYSSTMGATSSVFSHADRPAMPAPPLSPPPPAITVAQANRAYWYVYCNAIAFAMALALVVLLVVTAKNTAMYGVKLAMYVVKLFVPAIACFVAATFVLGTSDEPHVRMFVSLTIGLAAGLTIFTLSLPFILEKIMS